MRAIEGGLGQYNRMSLNGEWRVATSSKLWTFCEGLGLAVLSILNSGHKYALGA
jgi:hypothetical protein